ncbi:DUF3391 domain-containing protein [Chitinimonas sp. BJB300]|uniref:DUF3391 domain-containing protein n=1 Tax=Chitinimonas sp. BJB300 TaxID=1559339 RepID=UPI0035B54ECE
MNSIGQHTLSQFKIKSQDQIYTLRSLGLERMRYDPKRSDVVPLPPPHRMPKQSSQTAPVSNSLLPLLQKNPDRKTHTTP